MKRILKYILTFIIMVVIFCITLTLTSMISNKSIEKNVIETSNILNKETNRLFIPIISKKLFLMFDNYTDALMVNTAYSIDNKTPFYSAMVARKNYIEDITEIIHTDISGELVSPGKYTEYDAVAELNDTVNKDITESYEYARYWHGYLIFLRPLFLIFNITQIRTLLLISFAILAVVFLYIIYKKIDLGTAIIFLLGFIICDYFYIGKSLQGTSVFMIAMISALIMLIKDIKDKPYFFMIIGSLACFFDFLTVPIVTLGIPLLVNALMKNKKEVNIKEILIEILKCCVLWGIGYFGIWFIKWILMDVLYSRNLIHKSMEQFMYRTGGKLSFFEVINQNFYIIKIPIIASIFITIISALIKLRKASKVKVNLKEITSYLIIGCLALGWYFLFREHSYAHAFFTYRNFWLISTSLLLIIYNFFKEQYSIKK